MEKEKRGFKCFCRKSAVRVIFEIFCCPNEKFCQLAWKLCFVKRTVLCQHAAKKSQFWRRISVSCLCLDSVWFAAFYKMWTICLQLSCVWFSTLQQFHKVTYQPIRPDGEPVGDEQVGCIAEPPAEQCTFNVSATDYPPGTEFKVNVYSGNEGGDSDPVETTTHTGESVPNFTILTHTHTHTHLHTHTYTHTTHTHTQCSLLPGNPESQPFG